MTIFRQTLGCLVNFAQTGIKLHATARKSLLTWLRDEKRKGGSQDVIGFAVSANLNPGLREEIVATAKGSRSRTAKTARRSKGQAAEVGNEKSISL